MAPSNPERDDREARIKRALAQLNEWDRMAGQGHPADPQVKSTGESNARIQALKEELMALGALYLWDGEAYVLEAVAEPDQGAEGPEATPLTRSVEG